MAVLRHTRISITMEIYTEVPRGPRATHSGNSVSGSTRPMTTLTTRRKTAGLVLLHFAAAPRSVRPSSTGTGPVTWSRLRSQPVDLHPGAQRQPHNPPHAPWGSAHMPPLGQTSGPPCCGCGFEAAPIPTHIPMASRARKSTAIPIRRFTGFLVLQQSSVISGAAGVM
jgi:hypothetical protein